MPKVNERIAELEAELAKLKQPEAVRLSEVQEQVNTLITEGVQLARKLKMDFRIESGSNNIIYHGEYGEWGQDYDDNEWYSSSIGC